MRDHGLLLTRHTGRPLDTRSHEGRSPSTRVIGAGAHGFDCLRHRELVRLAFALDCCDREATNWVATISGITGDMVRT
jgi:putative transposase